MKIKEGFKKKKTTASLANLPKICAKQILHKASFNALHKYLR